MKDISQDNQLRAIMFLEYSKVSESPFYLDHKDNIDNYIKTRPFSDSWKIHNLNALRDIYIEDISGKLNSFLDANTSVLARQNFIKEIIVYIDSKIKELESASVTEHFIKFENLEVVKEEIISVLYIRMKDRFISGIDKNVFFAHFLTNDPNQPPIDQIGDRYDFICLMDEITKYFNGRILNKGRCDKWLSLHFTFKGKTLSAKQISTSRAKKKGEDPKSCILIKEIVAELKKECLKV